MGNSLKLSKQQPYSSVYEPLINKNLRVFSFAELKKATINFREERVVDWEDGSTRIFYKGYINDSRTKTRITVCVMQECHSSRTLQDWKEEVECLGQISHPNLVRHLGYCCEDGKRFFLVSEYLHKGSLDRHIFLKEDVFPWEMRIKIAIGTAQGLAFYHSVKTIPLHEELRMHNILLDEKFNAKLFYLAPNDKYLEETRFGLEYEPPEMYKSVTTIGLVGTDSDVYIFGLILLELLTGSKYRKQNVNQNSCFSDNYKIGEIIDPRLENGYHVNAATQMVILIRRCTKKHMIRRPSMQQVLDTLNNIAEIED